MRILIADDEPIARRCCASISNPFPALEFAGEARTGAETLACIFDLKPDIVLLDFRCRNWTVWRSCARCAETARLRSFL